MISCLTTLPVGGIYQSVMDPGEGLPFIAATLALRSVPRRSRTGTRAAAPTRPASYRKPRPGRLPPDSWCSARRSRKEVVAR